VKKKFADIVNSNQFAEFRKWDRKISDEKLFPSV